MTSCKNKLKVYYCGQKSKRYRYNVYYRSPNLINMGCKGAFVLGENDFRKSFSPKPHVWLQRKMKFSENSLPVDRNLRL